MEFHAELKNAFFCSGSSYLTVKTLKLFVIQTDCLQLYNGSLLVFWKV